MTDVSVVVPTRNRSALLSTTLRSVLAQRSVDLEVIVVDEASTDDTPELVARLDDRRVALLRHETPLGPSAARNHGAERARGTWLAFIDDDDVWAPDKLARQLEAARHAAAAWAYAGVVNVGETLDIISGAPPPPPEEVVSALPRYNPIPGGNSNVVLTRDLARDVGGFDERLSCADWELWARLAERAVPSVASAPLVGYRVHATSMSLDVSTIRREARMIAEIHASTVDHARLHRWFAESYLRRDRHAAALLELVLAAARGGALDVARDLLSIVARRMSRWRRRPVPRADDEAAWRAEAEAWLRVLVENEPGPPKRPLQPETPGTMPPTA